MCLLYLDNTNLTCYMDSNQLTIKEDNKIISQVPIETIDGVVVRNYGRISSKTITQLMTRKIPLTFIDKCGKYIGSFFNENVNINKQRIQFNRKNDEDFCLDFSKKIIHGKVHNQIVILRRYNTNNLEIVKNNISDIKCLVKKIERSATINELNGYEGIIAKIYFDSLSILVKDDFKFKGRSRRPPKDAFNALLSLGYTLLFNEIFIVVNNSGLNPYGGFMHQDRLGHAALVSDLMEEWRAVIVDALVMSVISKNIIKISDFSNDPKTGGIYLSHDAYKKFILSFDKKINNKNSYLKQINAPITFRTALYYKVNQLYKSIENNDLSYYEYLKMR